MTKLVKNITEMLDPKLLVQNSYLFALLTLFLTMYGPRLQPKLPSTLRNLFDNIAFRLIVLFLIGYLSSKNFQVSIVIALIFVITMNLIHTDNVLENFKTEGFVINGPPVADCNNYNTKSFNLIGTPYYPLHDNNNLLYTREGENSNNVLKYDNEIKYQ